MNDLAYVNTAPPVSFFGGFSQAFTTIAAPPLAVMPPSALKPVRIDEAINETIAEKLRLNLRGGYVRSLGHYLRAFARGREDRLLHTITSEELEDWFTKRNESPCGRLSNVGRLSAMFSLGIRRKWCLENPTRSLDKPVVERKTPTIVTVEQAAELLRYTSRKKPRYVAWLTLALFAGIRPQELDRLSWDNVRLADRSVVIDAAASKVRARRSVDLHPSAVRWLRWAKKHGGEIGTLSTIGLRRFRRLMAKRLRWREWHQDVLRHSAATYMLANYRDAGKVATMLGNSPSILLRHYAVLVTREQAESFYRLTPDRIV